MIAGRAAYLQLRDGRASVLVGEGDGAPDATITLDAATVAVVGAGRASAVEAVLDGRIVVDGDAAAIDELLRVFAEPTAIRPGGIYWSPTRRETCSPMLATMASASPTDESATTATLTVFA